MYVPFLSSLLTPSHLLPISPFPLLLGITAMKLTGRRRRVTTPFSASSRDPGGNFAGIEELFQEGDQPEYPVSLTVRVTARDERTGRMALLFSSNKRSKRWVENLGVEMGVPEGTLVSWQGGV